MLKDGQIVEQGNHAELVAKGGLFASMWADQVSSEDGASSIKSKKLEKEPVAGYAVDDAEPAEAQVQESEQQVLAEEPLVDTPEAQAAELAPTTDVLVPEVPVAGETATDAPAEETPRPAEKPLSAPIAFPTSDGSTDAVAFPSEEPSEEPHALSTSPPADSSEGEVRTGTAPVAFAFPGSETSSQTGSPALSGAASPGVTFQDAPSPGRATPDADQDGKRRRTLSTQGMQRLARRISISGRRQGSSNSIPTAILNSFKRDTLSREGSREGKDKDAAAPKDGSTTNVREDGTLAGPVAESSTPRDSPSGSVASDINKTKEKKDKKKKEKKRKSMGPV